MTTLWGRFISITSLLGSENGDWGSDLFRVMKLRRGREARKPGFVRLTSLPFTSELCCPWSLWGLPSARVFVILHKPRGHVFRGRETASHYNLWAFPFWPSFSLVLHREHFKVFFRQVKIHFREVGGSDVDSETLFGLAQIPNVSQPRLLYVAFCQDPDQK